MKHLWVLIIIAGFITGFIDSSANSLTTDFLLTLQHSATGAFHVALGCFVMGGRKKEEGNQAWLARILTYALIFFFAYLYGIFCR